MTNQNMSQKTSQNPITFAFHNTGDVATLLSGDAGQTLRAIALHANGVPGRAKSGHRLSSPQAYAQGLLCQREEW
jgi:hypothetical protein